MKEDQVEVALPMDVLCRLLRERSLVASEFRCLNRSSGEASRRAIKLSLIKGHDTH